MKRLREYHDSTDPAMRRAAKRLLGLTTPAPDEGAYSRVYQRLVPTPRAAPIWRFALVALVFLILITGAALARVLVPRLWPKAAHPSSAPQVPQIPVVPKSTQEEPPAPPHVLERLAPIPPDAPRRLTPKRVLIGKPPSERTTPANKIEEEPASATLLLSALRALREENDPQRAASLLSNYLALHPDGEQAEEALALLVEASAALKEQRAKSLGARYLKLYPHGRYRDTVRMLME